MEEHANRFALYEAYESEEAAMAHKETPHYQEWREKVGPWMARTREGIRYRAVMP
jgi:autoinducer 2-degrading protein